MRFNHGHLDRFGPLQLMWDQFLIPVIPSTLHKSLLDYNTDQGVSISFQIEDIRHYAEEKQNILRNMSFEWPDLNSEIRELHSFLKSVSTWWCHLIVFQCCAIRPEDLALPLQRLLACKAALG